MKPKTCLYCKKPKSTDMGKCKFGFKVHRFNPFTREEIIEARKFLIRGKK